MAWIYIWLIVAVVAMVVEFITSEMVSIWFVGGAILGMVLDAVGVVWYVQLICVVVLSLVLLIAFRKLALKLLAKNDGKTNADAVIGKEFRLIDGIDFDNFGTIKVNGVVWTVIAKEEGAVIKSGAQVKVVELKGNKYVVEEVK